VETRLRKSKKPFYFDTSEYLISIGRETAANLSELLESLRRCPADSVFQHTFRTLQDSASRNADEPSRKTLVTSLVFSAGAEPHPFPGRHYKFRQKDYRKTVDELRAARDSLSFMAVLV
jgi:hypothetical protein